MSKWTQSQTQASIFLLLKESIPDILIMTVYKTYETKEVIESTQHESVNQYLGTMSESLNLFYIQQYIENTCIMNC